MPPPSPPPAAPTSRAASDPFFSLLVRSPTGAWSRATVALESENTTRPILLLDDTAKKLYVLFTSSQVGGDIQMKTSAMSPIGFGGARTVIQGSAINNVTSTKQNLNADTGLVALASDDAFYWHVDMPLDGVAAPLPPPPPPPPGSPPPPPVVKAVFAAVADAHVTASTPFANFGRLTALRAGIEGDMYRAYLKFQVAGISAPIIGAKLRLQATTASVDGGDVYAVSNTWSETGIGWDGAPALLTRRIATAGPVAKGAVEIDLGHAVTANGTYSFALAGSAPVAYSSRESSAAPQLVLSVG
jgi:hypothetical protein